MTIWHQAVSIRGIGRPAPHGLVCSCGLVVPFESWPDHAVQGNPELEVVAMDRRTGELHLRRRQGDWMEEDVQHAFGEYTVWQGSPPGRLVAGVETYRSLLAGSQARWTPPSNLSGGFQAIYYLGVPMDVVWDPRDFHESGLRLLRS